MNRARAAYYALITHIDDQIGRLLNALQEYGVYNNTMILFTSDHGELLGDHHYFRKGLPYEGSAKIPFMISDPSGKMGFHAGSEVNEVIELRDIMPTLLSAAGVSIPPTVEGLDLLPLCRGEAGSWREYIHGEHSYGRLSNHYATDGKEKYLWFSQTGEEQLFDLTRDPQELIDLSDDSAQASRLALWRQRVIAELEGREEGYVQNGELVTGRPAVACLSHITT